MKKIKIVIAVLLCLAFITPLLGACAKDGNTEQTDGGNPADNTDTGDIPGGSETAVETKDPDAPELPAVDMGGKTFTFMTANWGDTSPNLSKDIGGEEQTGDPIDDAAFNRRIKIEQQYNCKIKQLPIAGGSTEALDAYRTSILAADGSYDVGITACTNFSSLLTGNYLADFKELTYVDMDKPYWNKNFYDTMSILGKNYAVDGDISKRRLECVWIMAFSKELIQTNGFESPYDLVKSGQWTYDKMHEMGRQAAKDLNSDGKMTLEDDLWGINYTGDTIMGIVNSSGVKLAEKNSEGIPELTVGNEVYLEKLMRIYDDMRNHDYSIDTLFKSGGGLTGLGDVDVFADKRALFLACASHNISAAETGNNSKGLRQLDVEFGIIPYPKWDAAQADYTPFTAGNYHPVLTVPQTNNDLDNTGIILEAMAYEGRKMISPAFYDSLLKTKTARDEESLEMIDYIFGNLNYDLGVMYNFSDMLRTFGYEPSTNIRLNVVSTIDKNINVWQKAIDKIIKEIEKAG